MKYTDMLQKKTQLPESVWIIVNSYLSLPKIICKLALVSYDIYCLTQAEPLWYVLCLRDFPVEMHKHKHNLKEFQWLYRKLYYVSKPRISVIC